MCFEGNNLSMLIGVLDQANQDEHMHDMQENGQLLNENGHNQDPNTLVDLQDQVQMFESMGLKNEF